MKHSDLEGTFQSIDMPPYAHADGKVFTIKFWEGEKATLWQNDGSHIDTLTHGVLTINSNPPLFEFSFEDEDHRHEFDIVSGLDFKNDDPKSFVLDIPEHGKRYFQELKV